MISPPPTDLDLVRGLHKQDREAFSRVYGEYRAAVYNLCARILGDREEAKDVTQDVFLTAFEKPPAPRDDVRLRPWLFRVATNACLNRLRSRRTTEPAEADQVAAVDDPFERARTASLIEASLANVNERYRATLVLKDLQGLETRELAEVLEVSRPAADVLVHRARAAFRRAFVALAGEDAVVPASLVLALPALPVPATLQALPLPLPAGPPSVLDPSAAGHPAPISAGPLAAATGGGAAAAAPAGGLLAKIGAAATTKAAVVAAGAALAAGGGTAAIKLAGDAHHAPAGSSDRAALTHHASSGRHAGDARTGDWSRHRHAIAAHAGDGHAGEKGDHPRESGRHSSPETHRDHTGRSAAAAHDAEPRHTKPRDSGHHTAPSPGKAGSRASGSHDGDHRDGDDGH
ncbi:MAG TPA: sigma-70 family RNA polymerase sigma factor [Thermoleophilia bacterium]|nr:sigma-70 family RNA polymerase sigma factor [Thermoleophilia bacterium]